MQKLDKPQTKEYGPLTMWASDLEDLFGELKNCVGIEFVADDVKFRKIGVRLTFLRNNASLTHISDKYRFCALDTKIAVPIFDAGDGGLRDSTHFAGPD